MGYVNIYRLSDLYSHGILVTILKRDRKKGLKNTTEEICNNSKLQNSPSIEFCNSNKAVTKSFRESITSSVQNL